VYLNEVFKWGLKRFYVGILTGILTVDYNGGFK